MHEEFGANNSSPPRLPTFPETAALRRTRSDGDVGQRHQQTGPIHRQLLLQFSGSHSDVGDDHNEQQQLVSTRSIHTPASSTLSPPYYQHHRHHSTALSGLRREERPTFLLGSSGEHDATGLGPRGAAVQRPPGFVGGARQQHEANTPPTPGTPLLATATATNRPRRTMWYSGILTFLGIGRDASRERRSLIGLFLNLGSGSAQIITITVILALSGTRLKSPTEPSLTEWQACSRPLGIWSCIWVVRALLACSLNYWGFLRERQRYQHRIDGSSSDPMQAVLSPASSRLPGAPTRIGSPLTRGAVDNRHQTQTNDNDDPAAATLPYHTLYSRLTLLSSLLTLSWFLTAHILEYTSVNTCRHSSPHLWWLTFGILCLMYLMVLEIVLLGLVVFIIAPILFLCWNIILICTGRHPLQTTNIIKPEVGKLPKALVDRIPLVMYIPPPPDVPLPEKVTVPKPVYGYPPKPKPAPVIASRRRFQFIRRLSSPFRANGTGSNTNSAGSGDVKVEPAAATGSDIEGRAQDIEKHSGKQQQNYTWEEHWESGEYPFVVLEGNRAACAICLMDFEEPKRVVETPAAAGSGTLDGNMGKNEKPSQGQHLLPEQSGLGDASVSQSEKYEISEVPVTPTPETPIAVGAESGARDNGDDDMLKLNDAGEGAQPLRLLTCGHVFHKTCLDPWLIDVSGRCPVCQRAVELPEESSKDKRRQRTSRRDRRNNSNNSVGNG